MVPAITLCYAGLLALWFMALSARVVQRRMRERIDLGDDGDPAMLRRIRAHANFAEYVPLLLVMMAMIELAAAPSWLLHALGATLLLARVLHGIGLAFASPQWQPGRYWGTLLTFVLLVLTALAALWFGLTSL